MTPVAVTYPFATSAERQTIVITQDYLTILNRAPRPDEVGYWLSQAQSGSNRATIEAQILASDE
jgi:hypothetical protein